jgi:DNA-binding GntR family transcriptional regulator
MTSASEKAYLTIRDLITHGRLKANDLLIAEDLANYCGVSRTPVREAILRLQAEMFAIRLDNKRTVVRSWSVDEIEDFVELRVRLAGYAAARAAVRVTDEEIAILSRNNAKLEKMLIKGFDEQRFGEISTLFYDFLIDIADSERLRQITGHILNPSPLLRALEQISTGIARRELVKDHGEIISALANHDPVWAEAAMTVHLRKTYRGRPKVSAGAPDGSATRPEGEA